MDLEDGGRRAERRREPHLSAKTCCVNLRNTTRVNLPSSDSSLPKNALYYMAFFDAMLASQLLSRPPYKAGWP
jgi:hypothetical protein